MGVRFRLDVGACIFSQVMIYICNYCLYCCRLMDDDSARVAAKSWQAVLKEYANVSGGGVSTWYFHQAAMESRLCFHSVCAVAGEPWKDQR